MKALVCEMCGSQDLIKQDGMFVCQSCGTKYSVEDAKKMMVEGTVQIDNSAYVEKFLANARRARQKEDWEEVEKYYNLVEQNDPSNIEAIFYSAYGKAKMSMVSGDIYKRQQICGVFCNSISVIDDNYSVEQSDDNHKIIWQMNSDLIKMYAGSFVYTQKKNGYGNVVSDNRNQTYFLFAKMALAFIDSIKNIIKVDDRLEYWQILYFQYTYLASNSGLKIESRNKYRDEAISIGKKIQEKDPSFTPNDIPEAKSSGCYVATAVYGSYDCPQVWTLRRYRDYALAGTWYGRAFIHTYYAISPTLVKWFGTSDWFKKMWKPTLDKLVSRLNSKGISDTAYQDRAW